MRPGLISPSPEIDARQRMKVEEDFERFAAQGLPEDIAGYVRDTYLLDLTGRYGGRDVKIPFGKASGQLSVNLSQIRTDAESGLGFCVLKTVIAEDESGNRMMQDWVVDESAMRVEHITGRRSGRKGFTVTWKGRGWHGTLEDYCTFLRGALEIGKESGMVVAPSCKYHLPGSDEDSWSLDEYLYTTRRLQEVWASIEDGRMIVEKDFSPTLAGSGRALQKQRILEWVRTVPRLIKASAKEPGICLGIKVMNSLFEDEFQVAIIRELAAPTGEHPVDFIVYANRLFDETRVYEGTKGVAFGGPDLSDRNLAILRTLQEECRSGRISPLPPISGTGNIVSGRTALEYALAGAESLQMHTVFQLPSSFYCMKEGTRIHKALHKLLFHPIEGLVPWMLHIRNRFGLVDRETNTTRFLDLKNLGVESD